MTDGPLIDPREPLTPTECAFAERAERYRSLFAYCPHGVFSLDLRGRYTDANDALQLLTGRSLDDLLAVDYHHMIHPEDVAAAEKAFAAVKERRPQLLEARLITATGDVVEVKITAVPVVVSDQVVGVHGIAEDVTEVNRMQRDAEAANTAKTLFLANVSHEVRTPLTMILGGTEMLLDTDLDPGQGHFVDMVHRSSQRLLRLVNDILDFSRLEAGKVSLRPAPFRMADVLDDLLEWAQPWATAQGLRLGTSVDPGVPPVVHGDALRVGQVLANLVSNALKFTESGSVDITVGLAPASTGGPGRGGTGVVLAVTDTGMGVEVGHLESLFDSFSQADPSATRSHSGVGLGLAICRDLVDLMGGELHAVSTPGVGSTFTATLPLLGAPGAADEVPWTS